MALAVRQHLSLEGSLAGWLVPLLAAGLAFTIHRLTLAPDLTWAYHGADGAELITASVTLGVPHPPGYPTYVLLGHLASWLPAGSVPFRFNLLSALAMAAAIAFLAAAAYSLPPYRTKNRAVAALATALTLAFLPLIWQQALIAEVYALNLAVVTALLLALLLRWPVPLAGLLFGLSLTTHLTSLLLGPIVLGLTERREWLRLGAATVIGLAPFLALPLLARQGSPVIWGQPEQLAGWWWLVTAELYRPNLFAAPLAEIVARVWDWLWSAQLIVPAVALLVAVPIVRQPGRWRSARHPLLLLVTAALYFTVSLTYRTPDAVVLLLPGLACAVLLLVPAFGRLGPASLLLPVALLLLNFNRLDLSADREVRELAQPLLAAAPFEAILLTEGDATTFTLWYLHEVEGQRPDITVIDRNLFGFDWYRQQLAARHHWLPTLPAYDLDALAGLSRPLCDVRLEAGLAVIDC
jgi:hypothetical protein